MRACTAYSCQVAQERLTRETVVTAALKLAETEGLDAVTIRRLARRLGVTPMALYWHFKSKDELLLGMAEQVMSGVTADLDPAWPWHRRLRAMVEALAGVLRTYPFAVDLLRGVDKNRVDSFLRATNIALELLAEAGFTLQEGFMISSYLLDGVIALVQGQPGCEPGVSPAERLERRRQKRLELERLPADRYPNVVTYAATLTDTPDLDCYFSFGLDLLLAGVEEMSRRRS